MLSINDCHLNLIIIIIIIFLPHLFLSFTSVVFLFLLLSVILTKLKHPCEDRQKVKTGEWREIC